MEYNIPLINRGFSEINPLNLGWEDCMGGHSFGPHIRSYYLVHYVCSGKGMLRSEQGEFFVHGGEVFVIRPGQETVYIADGSDPWNYIWVGFDGRLAKQLELLPSPVQRYLPDTFFKMKEAVQFSGTREEFVAGQIYLMLAYLLQQDMPQPSYEQQAADYIRSNYMRPITIEEIAEMIGIDRRYLTRRFKAAFHMTIQDFLIQTRLRRAGEYLKQGKSLTDAALLSGYFDVPHFSKSFKKQFGITPGKYCRQSSR